MKLATILDSVSDQKKMDVAMEFWTASLCCMDTHFSARLRKFMEAGPSTLSTIGTQPRTSVICKVRNYGPQDFLPGGRVHAVAWAMEC